MWNQLTKPPPPVSRKLVTTPNQPGLGVNDLMDAQGQAALLKIFERSGQSGSGATSEFESERDAGE